jgi:phenylalanyl-tRNA synthetase beta chain
MKFSYHWLRELVEDLEGHIGQVPPAELARLITLKTAECEGVESHGADSIIEVDNKSLTHRPDLWGHHGMAREVAAITGKKLIDPVKPRALGGPRAVHIDIENFELCPRYSALVFENVTEARSAD